MTEYRYLSDHMGDLLRAAWRPVRFLWWFAKWTTVGAGVLFIGLLVVRALP